MPTQRSSSAGARGVFLLAGLPFVFLWLLSHGDRGGVLALAPILLCVALAARPSRGAWLALFGIYLVVTAAYGLALAADAMSLVGGEPASILLDLDDAVVFVLLWLALAGLTVALFRFRPRRIDELRRNPFAYPESEADAADPGAAER